MTTRRVIPYILTIVVFNIIYWLTMIIPNHNLYLGFGENWDEVVSNNKLPLHREIFFYGLTFVVLAINLLEIITTKNDKFLVRIIKTFLTIIITYLFAALIFKLLDVTTLNLFYYSRGTPAIIFVFATIISTSIGLFIFEAVKRNYLFRFDKSLIDKYVPTWLKMEKNSL